MIPVEFVDDSDGMAWGWYALPQVPSIGECVKLPGIFTAEVRSVLWEWAEVPSGAMNMKLAGLASIDRSDLKLLARVRLHRIEQRETDAGSPAGESRFCPKCGKYRPVDCHDNCIHCWSPT